MPPHQQYWQVHSIFVKFGKRLTVKWESLSSIEKLGRKQTILLLKEILLGYYSDPLGVSFY